MRRKLSMDQRLREYVDWLRHGSAYVPVSGSIFGRIQEMQANAGSKSEGFKPDIIDGVPCRPDGGIGALAQRMGRQIAIDTRCREIHDLMPYLPEPYQHTFMAAYTGPERRTTRQAATILKISTGAFQKRKAALLGWFEGAMFRGLAV